MRTIQQLFKAFSDYMTVWLKVKMRQGDPENFQRVVNVQCGPYTHDQTAAHRPTIARPPAFQRVIFGNISFYSEEALPVTKKTLFLQHNTQYRKTNNATACPWPA
jgi:hypothetical protein